MIRRTRVSQVLLVACLLAGLLPVSASAGSRIDEIPVISGLHTSVLYLTITPAGSAVLDVHFVAAYDNRGTGFDAADAIFQLYNFESGASWTLTGSQLGWSGEGVFQAVSSTSVFDGPLEGNVYWETLTTYAPGNLDGEFRVHIDLPEAPPKPDRPDRP